MRTFGSLFELRVSSFELRVIGVIVLLRVLRCSMPFLLVLALRNVSSVWLCVTSVLCLVLSRDFFSWYFHGVFSLEGFYFVFGVMFFCLFVGLCVTVLRYRLVRVLLGFCYVIF